ncbi:hypothetical protein BCR42DRAFT_420241 [Absidia repens]|uniref:Uncharacterized protein n=1 Tax=Absidia repens TaxID=90262 RepID=A0A1X2I9L9_9FUNG|nr:hypothetical protein BCR42DRAFT_420241 [Absidia repens]
MIYTLAFHYLQIIYLTCINGPVILKMIKSLLLEVGLLLKHRVEIGQLLFII